ncbi:putative lipid II flippase FtsW [Microlunatus parietis]|uniref:Probable peptidoglycan glycosyltransferase FtsW n=1 Tax=Microlunatus parietis TaxID=682979 RepID=A0A7Y9IDS2_9ACTN|nr:putative lipid II flippase FtsW [Microlunatus parietis]NYE74872.1 cell division protein FtsW [Microlunatus parietis]
MATVTGPLQRGGLLPGSNRSGSRRSVGAWLEAVLDRPLASYHLVLGATGILVALGMMMVLSASSVSAELVYDDAYYYVKRQGIFLAAGLAAGLLVMKLPPKTLRVLSWAGLALAAVLLILTYVPGLGRNVGGNQNWLYFGSSLFMIQPSEFAKFAMVVWGADVLARKQKLLDQPRHLIVPYLPATLILVLLVVFQRDAGTAVVLASIMVGVLWVVGAPLRIFVSIAVAGVAGVVGLFLTSSNRMTRLAAFLDPSADLGGANDQTAAGLLAVAMGGWWGSGIGGSKQKWGGLPEAHTDFIFAVIGEELGLFGSLIVLALFLILGYAGIRIAMRSDEPFFRYTAAGVTVWLMVQALINLAVVLRLLPVAGVPLPFLSYGGSALIANLMAIGVLLACARNEPAARTYLSRRSGRARPELTTVVGHRKQSKSAKQSKPAKAEATKNGKKGRG